MESYLKDMISQVSLTKPYFCKTCKMGERILEHKKVCKNNSEIKETFKCDNCNDIEIFTYNKIELYTKNPEKMFHYYEAINKFQKKLDRIYFWKKKLKKSPDVNRG